MTQRYTRLIGGLYRVGQILSAGPVLTICTAYNRNTNDVVGLFIIELPPQLPHTTIKPYLQILEQRRMLQSPHILRIYRWGMEEHYVYIATDRPRGVSLQYIFDHEDIDTRRAIDLIRQLASGLDELHQHHIAGMDLRPQHITVDTVGLVDRVQIDDIGLHPLLSILNSQHHDSSYFNPRYAPPEYINHGPIGPWSDIYQLGLLLFTMITGRPPFVGRSEAETGILQSISPVPRMVQYAHETPPALQEVVNGAMAKEPHQRYNSIQHFLTALNQIELPPTRPIIYEPSQISLASRAPSNSILTQEMTSIGDDTATAPASPSDYTNQKTALPNATQPTSAYAFLCYERAGTEQQRLPITQKSVIVGRTDPKRGIIPDLDLSAFDTKLTVSRQHARIRSEENFFSIEDLKSYNKTRLKEEILTPFKPALLQDGDIIYFGKVRMRFIIPGPSLPPITPEAQKT